MGKVLVVDDEPAIRGLLRTVVGASGYTVMEADCARGALEIAATEGPFVLVVTDVLMPGIDGVELAQRLADGGHASAFLFISGYCDGEEVSRRADGFESCAFLAKPFSIPELLATMRRLIVRQRGAASMRDRRCGGALRRPVGALDQARALRRKAARLHSERALLVAACRAGLYRNEDLRSRIASNLAALAEAQRRLGLYRVS